MATFPTDVEVHSGMSPQSLVLRRRLAEALMKSGMETGPVGHWTQGAARLVNAIMGAMEIRNLEEAERGSLKRTADSALSRLPGGASPQIGTSPRTLSGDIPRSPSTPPAGLASVQSPSGADVTVNKAAADRFEAFLKALEQAGVKIDPSQTGGYSNRNIRGTNTPSLHATGRAVDVNWRDNPEGSMPVLKPDTRPFDPNNITPDAEGDRPGQTVIPAELARALATQHGLKWGGDFQGRSPDPMHFEVAPGAAPAPPVAQRGITAYAGATPPPAPSVSVAPPAAAPGPAPAAPTAAPAAAPPSATSSSGNPWEGVDPAIIARIRADLSSGDYNRIAKANADIDFFEKRALDRSQPKEKAELAKTQAQTAESLAKLPKEQAEAGLKQRQLEAVAAGKADPVEYAQKIAANEAAATEASTQGEGVKAIVKDARSLSQAPGFDSALQIARTSLNVGVNAGDFGHFGGDVLAPAKQLARMASSQSPAWSTLDAITQAQEQLSLVAGRAFLKGQGQVSNFERQMVRESIGGLSNAANAADFQFRLNAVERMLEDMNAGRKIPKEGYNARPTTEEITGVIDAGKGTFSTAGIETLAKKYNVAPIDMQKYVVDVFGRSAQAAAAPAQEPAQPRPSPVERTMRQRLMEALMAGGVPPEQQ